jgi:hypothetical protein
MTLMLSLSKHERYCDAVSIAGEAKEGGFERLERFEPRAAIQKRCKHKAKPSYLTPLAARIPV